MKKAIYNILNFINKFSLIFTIICLSIATIGATFMCINRSHDYLNPVILILTTIVVILAISKIYKFIQKLNDKQKKNYLCNITYNSFYTVIFKYSNNK